MTVLLTIHVIVTIAMIIVILLQKSDGSAALMGGGSSSSMFSTRGMANLLTHTTAVLATAFLSLCIAMTWVSTRQSKQANQLIETSSSSPKAKTETPSEPTKK